MTVEAPNVLPLPVASERYGIAYATLRELVNAGVFTKHVFDHDAKKPPIFVSVAELDAWKANGVDGVRAVQLRLPVDATETEHHETGSPVG